MTIHEMLPIYRLVSGCDYHRILLPFGYAGYDFNNCSNMTTEKLRTFKGIVFNRTPLTVKAETLIKLKNEYGTKVIMDLDDYWELYKGHYLYQRWMLSKTPERIKAYMGVADIVTCTTERLAEKARAYNKNVHVIPNALPFGLDDQFSDSKTPTDKTRFGFVGGTSHVADMRVIGPVFQHFNHIDFTYCGYTERSKEAVKIKDTCSNNMKNPNFKTVGQAPLDKYMNGYNGIDCCVAPLVDEEFNKYKSNLKVLEAGLKKCAIICSPNACYTDTVPDSVVTYCKSIKDWKEAIKKHQDLAYTKERGEKLYQWVKDNYNLIEVNKKRAEIYEKFI